ncbi:MAG TPA: hypothetical protein VNT81_10210 [Vicinamibacterales bacterium]|nr:hypothetical protein [Vicinamibacterales bacterium]
MPDLSRRARIVFAAWVVCAVIPVAHLMARHVAPFARGGQASFKPAPAWRVRHVLVAGCDCSAVVASALLARSPRRDLDERIVVVGTGAAFEHPLQQGGWAVDRLSATDVRDRYGVPGGPWLLVADPSGTERYSGGYATARPVRTSDVEDRRLIDAAIAGSAMAARPSFGCLAAE